jgi:putative chitinase
MGANSVFGLFWWSHSRKNNGNEAGKEMTGEQLTYLGINPEWLDALEFTFKKYEIVTPVRQAHFLGQCSHESNSFKSIEENLNYSANGLMAIWGSRFPTIEVANEYARKPEKIANKVYSGRMGNTEDGDGWKYRGRGVIQLTGKENYTNCGNALGIDLIGSPELILTKKYAALSAGWFWNKRDLNSIADQGMTDAAFTAITKKINGGTTGIQERIEKTKKAFQVLTTA